jgi:hypothetical protein
MEKIKITNKDIAEYIDKSIDTINGWKQRQPKLLEAVRTGIFCEKNNLDIDKINKLVAVQEAVRDNK